MKKRTGIGLSLTSLAPSNSIRMSHVAYWNRGWAHAKKEEYGAAIKDIQKASQLQPNEPGYQLDLEKIKALLTTKPEPR